MLTLSNITCKRGGQILFKDLGFTLGDSCLLNIRGDNGSGKTTLLKIIACLIKPQKGEILYANEQVTGDHWAEYCEIIQYLGHKNAIKAELTVLQNLEFWANLRKTPELIAAAISFFELEEVIDTRCGRLSAGWQRRVALAKLLFGKSEIWLLDEPFTNLDAKINRKLISLINTRCEQGGSVVIATHDDIPMNNMQILKLEDFK